mgnify:CR=1
MPFILKPYIKWANLNEKLVNNPTFNNFVIICIIGAGVLVGIQTYPSYQNPVGQTGFLKPEENSGGVGVVESIDDFILIVFSVECLAKLFAEGGAPWRYFVGKEWKWNNFDLVIVVACIPWIPVAELVGNVAFLRLLRLARLAKVFRKIPQLQMIVMGLVGGMKSIAYIVLLLFLVFYLYAIAGMMLFRDNDPFHWETLPTALMTLFRAATLEDWTDIMYFGIYGCDKYKSGGGITYCDVFAEECQGSWSECEVDVDEFGLSNPKYSFDCDDPKGIIQDSQLLCTHPSASHYLSPLYFVSFIMVSALVMLSLFVGAVTMAMSESMDVMKEEAEEKDRLRRLEKGKKAALELQQAGTLSSTKLGDAAEEEAEQETVQVVSGKQAREKARMKSLLLAAWEGRDAEEEEVDVVSQYTGVKKIYAQLAGVMEKITEKPAFTNFVTVVIIIAGAQVGLSTYDRKGGWVDTHSDLLFWVDTVVR